MSMRDNGLDPDYKPRFIGVLSSFGSPGGKKRVKKNSVLLEGDNGSGFAEIPSTQYRVLRRLGKIAQREIDTATDLLVDWDAFDPADGGNGYRVTYTVKNGATETTYTQELITFAEETDAEELIGRDGIEAGLLDNLDVESDDIGDEVVDHTDLTGVDTDTAPTAIHHTLGTGGSQSAAGNHAHGFTFLTDTPASYGGQARRVVRVNGAETGLEFIDLVSKIVVFDGAVICHNGEVVTRL